jgi:hypothetical protein
MRIGRINHKIKINRQNIASLLSGSNLHEQSAINFTGDENLNPYLGLVLLEASYRHILALINVEFEVIIILADFNKI